MRLWSQSFPNVNLIGPTADDVRDVMVLGDSGILNCCRKDERPRYLASAARLEWPNGAMSLLFSAEEPDRLRGKQHMKLWCDELAAWRRPDAFDQAMFGLRLGDKPQMVVTTTPRPTKIIKQLAADKDTIVTRGSTFDNKGHLARAFLERIARRYEGRVIGRQELMAEIVEETPGALWTRALIERQRVAPAGSAERIRRGRRRGRSAGAIGFEGRRMRARRRGQGGRRAALRARGPDQPGRLAGRLGGAGRRRLSRLSAPTASSPRSTTAATWWRRFCARPSRSLPVRSVTATRGKYLRAEPVAAAYERGLVFHAGTFAKLEDQLCALTPDFDRRAGGSPGPGRRARLGDRRPARPGEAEHDGDSSRFLGGAVTTRKD